jgi:hypothetical protein
MKNPAAPAVNREAEDQPGAKHCAFLNGKTKPARIGAFCVRHQEKEPCG